MPSEMLLLVLGGCLLGTIQLIGGIGVGMWLRRSESIEARRTRQDLARASEIARRLQTLTDEMTSSVGEHCSQLDEASQLLRSDQPQNEESVAKLVVNVIGNIVRANQKLQTKLETAESRLEEQATEIEAHISRSLTDPLTGLPNRREFDERLEERMAAWNRRGEVFSLLLLDVDYFKKLNDEHGHLVGDQVLAGIGRALRAAIRREDSVARYGGEEFAVLLPNTKMEQAIVVAENVREALATVCVRLKDKQINVTSSGGVATIRTNERADSLIQRADGALYAAKAAGRNQAFAHDGVLYLPVVKGTDPTPEKHGPAAELLQLINSDEAMSGLVDQFALDTADGFTAFLQRESISAALAESCEELRRLMDKRDPAVPRAQPS